MASSGKYIPPAKRASRTQGSSGPMTNWRATRSNPELATASADSLSSSSSSSEASYSPTRRSSVPIAAGLTAFQPVLADRLSPQEQASIFTELWREHQYSQLFVNDLSVRAKDVDDYKRAELEFRIWLVSQVDASRAREANYAGMQGISMTGLQYYKRKILAESIIVPAEVLALLKKAIQGREWVQDKYYTTMDPEYVGHQHHIAELQRIFDDLSAPVTPRLTGDKIRSLTSWR